ncbi:hypothetical protein BC826DRAFT_1113124 [Russula brevipes]|nr:hypothetical protein BC826DRAFT_1113124 [Russula brevipes]
MVNFRDPAVVARDFRAWALVTRFWGPGKLIKPSRPTVSFVKLLHTVAGLYIWEFVTTLDYEWSIFCGRRPYRWTIWIYSFTRVATLIAVILAIVAFDAKLPHTCQAFVTTHGVFAYLALVTAQFLIVLRIFAIWNRRRVVVATSIGVWVTNTVLLIQTVSRIRSETASPDSCTPKNIQITKINLISTLVTDVALLLIMLIGLLQLRVKGVGMLSLGQLLWNQGVVWLCIATATGALPVVYPPGLLTVVLFTYFTSQIFVYLDLNGKPLRIMFQLPALASVAISIAATRMYRSLTDFVFGFSEFTIQATGLPTSKVAQTPGAPIPLNRMEVAVHNSWIQHPATSTGDHSSQTGADKQANYKSNQSISEENM